MRKWMAAMLSALILAGGATGAPPKFREMLVVGGRGQSLRADSGTRLDS